MGYSNITDRKFTFCPSLSQHPLDHLIVHCRKSGRFFAACCSDRSFGGDLHDDEKELCHHFQLVFTDGACPNNGRPNARVGVGVFIGEDLSFSRSVDDEMDPGATRTNQRAELLAAIEGLQFLHRFNILWDSHTQSRSDEAGKTFIVVTDSEYVVKGITEWFPTWKRRNWRTADGRQPTNLDLFMKLDDHTTSLEREGITVGFWHIPRAYNHEADALAENAADL